MPLPPTYPTPGTQYDKVLQALLAARGDWVRSDHFLYVLRLSQFHARMEALEDDYHWPIEHSEPGLHGYRSYRITLSQLPLI